MDALKTTTSTWFSELSELWPGQAMSLEIESVLEDFKSDFQHIVVAKTKTYGNMLILDGAIQVTDRDECSYQEMIAHIPLFAHPDPRQVLIVGGGDGGVLREAVRHPGVERVVLCEIDGKVIEVAKKHFPNMACGFDSPKATVHVGDGLAFMRAHPGQFDVIITDSSDPIGPASALFDRDYYALMRAALRPGGIVCSQAESVWLHLPLITSMTRFCRELYPTVAYAHASVPTYPSGCMGFLLCSLQPHLDLPTPTRKPTWHTKFYTPELHSASFALPQFAIDALSTPTLTPTT